jgi:short-subunit dehydrogenase
MPNRAAIVTGASSGIGLAVAHMLGEEGHALTVAARRPEKLSAAAEELRGAGHEVHEVAGNMADEDTIKGVVAAHKERFGRLDALVVNTASISGKSGQPWLSVYSATKAGVIGYTQAMNKELNGDGIKSVALAPGFVETPMTEFVREHVPAEDMIRVEDVSEAVRFVLRTSPNCVIPEIVFQRPGEAL